VRGWERLIGLDNNAGRAKRDAGKLTQRLNALADFRLCFFSGEIPRFIWLDLSMVKMLCVEGRGYYCSNGSFTLYRSWQRKSNILYGDAKSKSVI
jgi:hypothetical protein